MVMKYDTNKPRRMKALWQADMRIVFRRYAVGFGLPFGAVIALAPLVKGITWMGGWKILIARLVVALVVCGGMSFGLGWLFYNAFERDQ
jgi:hypothetical protein